MITALKKCIVRAGKKQFLPSLEDVENPDLKELAKRLKGDSDKETLTNILKWEDKNVSGWLDRMYMFIFFYILLLASLLLLPIDPFMKIIIVLIFIVLGIIDITTVLSYFLPFIGMIILLFLWLFSINPLQAHRVVSASSLIGLSIMFGALTALSTFLLLKYMHIKRNVSDFELKDIFKLSLPVGKIINYRLAICRDYAKLTAALLFNLYPNAEVYFFIIPRHVAAAIKIKGKYYILDQRLPILTVDEWLARWDQKSADVYISKLIQSENGPIDVILNTMKK